MMHQARPFVVISPWIVLGIYWKGTRGEGVVSELNVQTQYEDSTGTP